MTYINKTNSNFPLVEIDLEKFGELNYYTKTITDANLELNEAKRTLTVKQNNANDYSNKKIATYANNPFGEFTKVELEGHRALKQGMELRNSVREFDWYEKNVKKHTYLEFKTGNEIYYLQGDANGRYEGVKNYHDWKEHFKVMDKSGEENSIYCDHNLITDTIGEKGMSFIELLEVYRSDDMEKREKLRKLVCRHHLEWNKDLYNEDFLKEQNLEGEEITRFEALAEKLDLWMNPDGTEVQEEKLNKLPPKEQIWFAHPVYFINHLDKAGLLRQPVEDRIKMGADIIKDVLPWDGPCFMRSLQGGVSSWIGINMTEEQIRASIQTLKPEAVSNDWYVQKPAIVIENAMELHGIKKILI